MELLTPLLQSFIPHVLWSPMHVNDTERVQVTPFDPEVIQHVVDEFWESFTPKPRDCVPLGCVQNFVGVSRHQTVEGVTHE